jgi:hypothetical protein
MNKPPSKHSPEMQHAMVDVALSMFIGDKCKGCGKTLDTKEEVKESVGWIWEHGRVGHEDCYKSAHPAQ